MRVGIITVFDAVNYGSYLQAFCLQQKIKSMGHEVVMIKTSSFLYEKWRMTSLFTYRPSRIRFKARLAKGYFRLWNNFTVKRHPKDLDVLIIGSDEMWELNNVTLKPLPAFYGIGITAKKKVTYAVGSNGTKPEDVEKFPFVISGLRELEHVSVRDMETYNTYKNYLNVEPLLSVDPTLLIDLNEYCKPTQMKDYILCYTYSFKPYMIEAVRKLKETLQKKVVVAGQQFEWADLCIAADAFEFLGLIKNADFIITDTFHGTTLSIALQKNFVSFAYKDKVYQALKIFDLLSRNYDDSKDLIWYYNNAVDYQALYSCTINDLKKQSENYLQLALSE